MFAREHGLKIGTIADLIQYRSEHETMIERLVERPVTTPWGTFRAVAYRDRASNAPHLALVHGDIQADQEALVRVHEPASVLDLLCEGATRHSWTIPQALQAISNSPSGVLVLLNCHGGADLLFAQFDAWARSGDDVQAARPVADGERHGLRTFGIGAQILRDLGVGQARLLARPRKMPSMAGFSLTITGYHNEPGVSDAAT